MERSLLDTCAISDTIRPPVKRLPTVTRHLGQYLREHGRLLFSEMSCYEILRGLRKKGAATQERQFIEFCRRAELCSVDYAVLDQAAALWADGQRRGIAVDDVDLVIAATALLHGLSLTTSNTRHFEWIEGLRLLNWREA
jgi:tRNA(fMet)-specific endonuclease VapC